MARPGLGYIGGGDAEFEGKPCLGRFYDKGSAESHRFYLARRTVMEMLRDRGYNVSESEIDRSLEDFRSHFGDGAGLLDRLRFSASLVSQPSQKVLVIFCGTDEIRKQAMSTILLQVHQDSSKPRVILVLQSKMNSHARKLADESSLKIETFHIADLLVNITKHLLLPKIEILTAEEKQKLLEKFNVKPIQIPRMLETDAITRYYGLEKGQMLKVTYNGHITGSFVTYRCIV